MRQIESRESREKKESRNRIILSIILVGLLVTSTAGYALYSTDKKEKPEEFKYKNFLFVKNNEFWDVQIGAEGFSFQNLPNETLDVEVNLQRSFQEFVNKPLYISSYSQGSQEILMNLGAYIQRAHLACIQEPCEEDLPVKNCTDNNFIIFETGEFNKISGDENCIYISYKSGEEVKASDAFLYKILGVA